MSRQSDLDNHANQLNPNNDAYWESRDWDECPEDWEERRKRRKTRETTRAKTQTKAGRDVSYR